MGLDNWFMTIKDEEDEENKYENLPYGGDDLPCEALDASLRQNGYFRGKFWSGLFDLLLDIEGSCYEQEIDNHTLQCWADDLKRLRLRMLEDEGEILWEKWKAEYIAQKRINSDIAESFTFEDAISVCMVVEWYAEQEEAVLVGWW